CTSHYSGSYYLDYFDSW
nr:immunoglobulin heavy chain junction region [Macaca mulatta]MOX59803.1 immunoglobulin heavy chain junction region [Macaca mulatta]MOX62260.1 immunoglobulin heavy chain junction region [Macaca mulatta]MOX65029.1 immunoglobulin heavy chain junction region [Macaca mulatta]MOX68498.1 immunoglobulin heavy chain junction region [Macaca mulatta]